jgi:hypothetical protein
MEFVLALVAYGPLVTREDQFLLKDIYFGLLTALYLTCMLALALKVTSRHDSSGRSAHLVEGGIRQYILQSLDIKTSTGLNDAPKFESVLKDVTNNLQQILDDENLFSDPLLGGIDKRQYAIPYIKQLERDFGHLDPKEIARQEPPPDRAASRNTTRSSFISNRLQRNNRHSASTLGTRNSNQRLQQHQTNGVPFVSDESSMLNHAPSRRPQHPLQSLSDPSLRYGRTGSMPEIIHRQGTSSVPPVSTSRAASHRRIVTDSSIPRQSSYQHQRDLFSGQRTTSMEAVQENETGDQDRFHPFVPAQGPTTVGIHYHPPGRYPSPTASPVPTSWGGSNMASPVLAQSQPRYTHGDFSSGNRDFFAGQQFYTPSDT